MEKTFEKLQIKDDFMFSIIMRDPKFCKPFLELVLGIKISRIEYPKSQGTILKCRPRGIETFPSEQDTIRA